MKTGIIGEGAIGRYVADALASRGLGPHVILTRSGPTGTAPGGVTRVRSADDLPGDLGAHGPDKRSTCEARED